jgi:hypothetical protein
MGNASFLLPCSKGVLILKFNPSSVIYFYVFLQGFDCCSDTAIGFHQLTPNQMYLYYYLIYRVNAYGIQDIRTEIQSKPQLPPDVNLQVKAKS